MYKKTYMYDDFGFLIVTPEIEREADERHAYHREIEEDNKKNDWHTRMYDDEDEGW